MLTCNNLGSRLQARVSLKALRSHLTVIIMGLDQMIIMGLDQMERRVQLVTMTEAIALTTTLSTSPVAGKPFFGPFLGHPFPNRHLMIELQNTNLDAVWHPESFNLEGMSLLKRFVMDIS